MESIKMVVVIRGATINGDSLSIPPAVYIWMTTIEIPLDSFDWGKSFEDVFIP